MTSLTLFVALTYADAEHWPALVRRARELGAAAAVLQGEGPSLADRLSRLSGEGVTAVHLVGVTFGAHGVPASWIGRVARWWLAVGEREMTVLFSPDAVRGLPSALPSADGLRPLVPREGGLTNPTWQDAPPVRCHLLVCRGPRCTAKGAERVIDALGAELYARGMLDDEVLLTQTGCLFPCNRAPVVAVQPDMVWHGPLRAEDVPAFVDELVSGERTLRALTTGPGEPAARPGIP
ncbi:MAG: (2Fe-2S) ferredoxin domain-containing protein [Propioniciclava sp.]|uniref:(2Fe-2S) ferredoxin domain-containing protein n=1 Tax=Propioniciclava sp. TaxID=2038686 RepID=UPI0039E26459